MLAVKSNFFEYCDIYSFSNVQNKGLLLRRYKCIPLLKNQWNFPEIGYHKLYLIGVEI